jgi:hypothetical protein
MHRSKCYNHLYDLLVSLLFPLALSLKSRYLPGLHAINDLISAVKNPTGLIYVVSSVTVVTLCDRILTGHLKSALCNPCSITLSTV